MKKLVLRSGQCYCMTGCGEAVRVVTVIGEAGHRLQGRAKPI